MRKKNNTNTQYLRPSEIGVKMSPKMTGNEINMFLMKYNFQEKLLEDGLRLWKPTAYGAQYSEIVNNTILWHRDMVRNLEKLVACGKKAV